MRAVVIEHPGRATLTSVEDPVPGSGDLVVAVVACGICGTDLHLLDGDSPLARYPLVPGHEFCGQVVAVGAGVDSLRLGQLVAVDPSLYCGSCRFCRAGRDNLCEHYNAIGVTRPGACADYVQVPAVNAFALPAGIPPHWGAVVEPLSCAVHGFDQVGVRLGARYLIYGAGTMGLLLAQLAMHAGADDLAIVEKNRVRGQRASQILGVTTVATGADLEPPQDWDVVIDATGAVPAIEDGLRRVARGGTFLMFGVASADAIAAFSPFRVYNDEIRIIGSMAVLHSFERALRLLASGVVACEAMISHRLPLEEYPTAIRTFREGLGLKVQLTARYGRS